MLTIVFGAGASFDALPDFPPRNGDHVHRLPLADGLFENRAILADELIRFAKCLPIAPLLRKPGVIVEEVLERLRAESETFPEGKRQLASVRYYIQAAIAKCGRGWLVASRGVSNYTTLLDQVDRHKKPGEPVLLVTFNYDLMLEDALSRRGHDISVISDYVAAPDYKLIKVHGSVNWGRHIVGRFESVPRGVEAHVLINDLIEDTDRVQFASTYEVVSSELPIVSSGGQYPRRVFPAIAIPLQNSKTTFECPSAHLEVMKEHLRHTTKLLTIGWRGRERHFLQVLKEANCTSPWVHAVAGSREDAEATLKALNEGEIFGPHEASGCSGFSDFVVSGEIEAFMKRGEVGVAAAGGA